MSVLCLQLVLLPPRGHVLKLLLSKHMSCLVEQLTRGWWIYRIMVNSTTTGSRSHKVKMHACSHTHTHTEQILYVPHFSAKIQH